MSWQKKLKNQLAFNYDRPFNGGCIKTEKSHNFSVLKALWEIFKPLKIKLLFRIHVDGLIKLKGF
jgi:hypothetical protein